LKQLPHGPAQFHDAVRRRVVAEAVAVSLLYELAKPRRKREYGRVEITDGEVVDALALGDPPIDVARDADDLRSDQMLGEAGYKGGGEGGAHVALVHAERSISNEEG
jgi:hypothetical protein